jgi:peptidoglycan/LPS O-acetylase OafA/YrhL
VTGHPPGARLGYIPAVDGLRALAIGSVMLFHLWPWLLPGGFTGVDIFFVISGFVIAGSVAGRRFETLGDFLAYFYAKRLMRIVPALVAMLLATTLAATLFIPEAWLSESAPQTGIAAFFGVSNMLLAGSANGYFGPQAAYNPFTHSWTLAVEAQFYLFLPLLLYRHQRLHGKRMSERGLVRLIAGLSLVSLALSALMAPQHGFYLFLPRFWELGAGMLLFLTLDQWRPRIERLGPAQRNALMLGSTLLVAAGFAIPPGGLFPFPLALLPVLGSAGLIATVRALPRSPVSRLFGWRPLVVTGQLSYSLYLWHWPVLVLFRWTVGLDTVGLALAALGIAVGLAVASYYLIEQPMRTNSWIAATPRPRVVRRALLGVAGAALAGTMILLMHDRISLSVTRDRHAWYADTSRTLDPARTRCRVSESVAAFAGGTVTSWTPETCAQQAGFAVHAIGDAHNLAYGPDYRQLAADLGVPVHAWYRDDCPFLRLNDAMTADGDCANWDAALLAELPKRARAGDVLFLPGLRIAPPSSQSGATEPSRPAKVSARTVEQSHAILARLAKGGLRLVLEAPKPVFPSPAFRCSDWFNRGNPACRGGLTVERADLEARRRPVVTAMDALADSQPGLSIWDPLPLLCPGDTCDAMPGDLPLFFDGDRLSGSGNDLVYPSLRDAIVRAAGKQ